LLEIGIFLYYEVKDFIKNNKVARVAWRNVRIALQAACFGILLIIPGDSRIDDYTGSEVEEKVVRQLQNELFSTFFKNPPFWEGCSRK
jgi:hypothetical protein